MRTRDEKKEVPSFDELVFENRNKEYGAYVIRRKYDLTVIWAILVGAFCVGASVITPFVIRSTEPVVITPKESVNVIFVSTDIPVDIPQQEPPKVEEVKLQPITYVAPEVVDSLSIEDANKFGTNEFYNENAKKDSLIDVLPGIQQIEIIPEPNNKIVEIFSVTEKPFFGTEGDNEFRRWIGDNLKYPQGPLENEIQGRVYVEFIVEKDGSLSNVVAIKSIDADLAKEAVRVVALSPKWNPGKQQGDPVRVRFTFPITFSLK
ncbi:MAG: energy transducer TonB [Tenuifilaceae bacterium]